MKIRSEKNHASRNARLLVDLLEKFRPTFGRNEIQINDQKIRAIGRKKTLEVIQKNIRFNLYDIRFAILTQNRA